MFYRILSFVQLLFNNATTEINGPINFIHQFIDMTNISLNYKVSCRSYSNFNIFNQFKELFRSYM